MKVRSSCTGEQIELFEYSGFFDSQFPLEAAVHAHWLNYYSELTPEDVSALLLKMGKKPMQSDPTKNKLLFTTLDLKRVLDAHAKTLTTAQQAVICASYHVWIDALQQAAADLLSEEEESQSLLTEEPALLATTAGPAITPGAALKRRNSQTLEEQGTQHDETDVLVKRSKPSPV